MNELLDVRVNSCPNFKIFLIIDNDDGGLITLKAPKTMLKY